MTALASVGPSAYWYLTRGTGAVSLALLTLSVVIGIAGSLRVSAQRWPRFAVDAVHRDVSLLVIVLLVIHIVTSVLDSFAPISITAAVVPFFSPYRPFWLGLGALSFDLVLALAVTSLLRRRLGYPTWRAIHWLAYACWPVAVLHGLGTGTDTKLWWMLLLTAVCVAAVVVAVCARVAQADEVPGSLRTPGIALCVAAPVALAAFTALGPLERGWARRSGTPASLLGHRAVAVAGSTPAGSAGSGSGAGGGSAGSGSAAGGGMRPRRFSASLDGSVRQAQIPEGAIVDLSMRLSGGARGRLRVRLGGSPIPGGGLSLTGSQVDLIATGLRSVMEGQITALRGERFVARVQGAAGTAMTLDVQLHIDVNSNAVTGEMTALPER